MTDALTSWTPAIKTVRVYTKRKADLANYPSGLPADWSDSGWVLDPYLHAPSIDLRAGSRPHVCNLRYKPGGGAQATAMTSIQDVLDRYSVDDHVQVTVEQADTGLEHVVFEGLLVTHLTQAQADARQDAEGADLTAFSAPWLDNLRHKIVGRVMYAGGSNSFFAEGLDLPAVFNLGGLPNLSGSGDRLFIWEGEKNADYWTARKALWHLWYWWVSGDQRFFCLDPALYEELDGTASGDAEYEGLDAELPQTNVQAMGILEAMEAVAGAVGFDLYVDVYQDANITGTTDRRYAVRIIRRNRGREVAFNLATRGSTYSDASVYHAANDFQKLVLVRDGASVRNAISGLGRAYIEAVFDLRPLWDPADMDGATIDADLQADGSSTYHQKHVEGGSQYTSFRQCGRLWGIDCDGQADGYASGFYAHSTADTLAEGGFDFVTALGLNSGAVRDARTAAGVSGAIAWSNRTRNFLPLRSPLAKLAGLRYVLLVNESGSTTLGDFDAIPLKFSPQRELCAIMFDGLKNLAAFNRNALLTGETPDAADSWWSLIQTGSQNLRFKLAAVVPADHAYRAFSGPRAASGSDYTRRLIIQSREEETWVHDDSPFNSSGDWSRIRGDGTWDPTYGVSTGLGDLVDQQQDKLDDLIFSGTIDVQWAKVDTYLLGDRVTQINGREIDLQTSSDGARYPQIVGLKYELGETQQAMRITLQDHRLTEGRA